MKVPYTGRGLLTRVFVALLLSAGFFCAAQYSFAQNESNAGIRGHVVVQDASGNSFVAGADIVLKGTEEHRAQSDASGAFTFGNVKPGFYTLVVTAPGLQTVQSFDVAAGATLDLTLKLELVAASSSVEVKGSAAPADISTATQTIEQNKIEKAPNADEKFDSLLPLVPGVVRGPDGRINMKGARSTQSGALVNSANVTDPASGNAAISLPIDVVSSVQVISNPFDPQYGRFAGALSTVETKTGNFEKRHITVQNILPRWRSRAGTIAGLGAATPRITYTGPLIRHRAALTQSFEYRFIRTPVNSLPPLQRDTKLEGFNSYTQTDVALTEKQTATVSLALYPQKLDYMGLNTFTPQPATADFKQRGFQVYAQDRYVTGSSSALITQFSYKTYDIDIGAQSDDMYHLYIATADGGFFNRQHRRSQRYEPELNYQFAPLNLAGSHQMKIGANFVHSDLQGEEIFRSLQLMGKSGNAIEQIDFSAPGFFDLNQNEAALFLSDQWAISSRLLFSTGVRADYDTITDDAHVAPRGSALISLTRDGKTLLKAGGGMFYDRVPLLLPAFNVFPGRTVKMLGPTGQVVSSQSYVNTTAGDLENPRSTAWNVEVDRQFTPAFAVRVGYENRNTAHDFVVSPGTGESANKIVLSNHGGNAYHEFQVTGRYQFPRLTINGSYVRSRAYGHLNDPFVFYGNFPQAVIQPDQQARLLFDAPNRVLFQGDWEGPWKLSILPVYDVHTGFPYSPQDEYRNYVGPRSSKRYPRFESADVQITRPFKLHVGDRRIKIRAGGAIFNVFNHDNPRDVQNNLDSSEFGHSYNPAWREFRGKMVFEF